MANDEIVTGGASALNCKKKLTRTGHPHKFEVIASLNAVKAWIENAKEYGDNYGFWHKASNALVKCDKKKDSAYYFCHASGEPCPSEVKSRRLQD